MLRIDNMTAGYDGKPVVALDNFFLPERGHCLVTGSSGGGKTTLLYAIAGLLPVIEGKIIVDRVDIALLRENEMDYFRGVNIGMIFQTLQLMPSLNVMENLLLASYVVGMPPNREYLEHILNRLGIYEVRESLPRQLSRGQAQRVTIARAVLHYPKLIIADEPTSSLDDRNCESVISIIKDLAAETSAALMIATHDSRVKAHFSNIIHFEQTP